MFVKLFRDGGVLLEDQAAGDQSIALALPEREARCLASLLALESFEVSRALGSLFLAGVREGHRATRSHPVSG